jgi:hypothetical protein
MCKSLVKGLPVPPVIIIFIAFIIIKLLALQRARASDGRMDRSTTLRDTTRKQLFVHQSSRYHKGSITKSKVRVT